MRKCPVCSEDMSARRKSLKFCSHRCYSDSRRGLSVPGGFTRGHTPANKAPVGSVRIRTRHGRGGVKRAWVKVAEPNAWSLRARHVWQSANGPIPPGMAVHHIDRDTLNDSIANLDLITQSDHAAEHHAETVAARMDRSGYRTTLVAGLCVDCGTAIHGGPRLKYCAPCKVERNRESRRRYKAKTRGV